MTLLTMRVYVFTCNAIGCEHDTGELVPPNAADGARSAWRVAKGSGWTRTGSGGHFCPEHRQHNRRAQAR